MPAAQPCLTLEQLSMGKGELEAVCVPRINLREGNELNGEDAPEYVDHTEFVKEAIGKGKVTLRLRNISVSDKGSYQCSFKGSGINDVASMNLSVTALGVETQILVQIPGTEGLMVECNSGGPHLDDIFRFTSLRDTVLDYWAPLLSVFHKM
ncbi:hypothetical protein J1605_012485 [Eschrichtius robustus]|uniref:Uncharacterized protein n=1 Tax=Eschrichtius robustus TaxID=9764 RepID=A0AB34GLC5_ESCRO|nr:hypothetical protein J1605_012485 [Eschrichtius robustus]